jgi:hypothetical protein
MLPDSMPRLYRPKPKFLARIARALKQPARPVLNRLGQMRRLDPLTPRQIRNRPGQLLNFDARHRSAERSRRSLDVDIDAVQQRPAEPLLVLAHHA